MNLSDMVTRVADDSNIRGTVSDVQARIVREINRVSDEIWNGFRWSFRWRTYRIITDIDATAGTVTLSNGSRTITGSGTAFSSSHIGWHIYFPGDSILNWYKIRAYTSSTQLEMDVPYTGTSGASKTYILRHFDYVLPTEPWDLGTVNVTADGRSIQIVEPTSLDVIGPIPLARGYPSAAAIYSSDFAPTVYSTGTLSGTINTTTLTGSGTSWLANIYPGDSVVIGSYTYTVRSVDSDTSISLYNYQQVASAAGTTYTITRQFGRVLRIMWPSSIDKYTIDIRALRLYTPLVNNSDTNELLHRCANVVALKTSALELSRQPDNRSELLEKKAEMALMKARAEDDALTPREQISPIYSYRGGRRGHGYRTSINY